MQYRPYNRDPMYPPDIYQQHPYAQHQQPNYPYSQQSGPPPQLQQTPYQQFAKPQQPLNWDPMQATHPNFNSQQGQQGPGPGGGFKAYFQDQDGQVDFDKMLSTVGQIASTYHQVSPIVKQFGSIIKIFK